MLIVNMEAIITVVIMVGNCVGLLYKQYHHNDNVYINVIALTKKENDTVEYQQ